MQSVNNFVIRFCMHWNCIVYFFLNIPITLLDVHHYSIRSPEFAQQQQQQQITATFCTWIKSVINESYTRRRSSFCDKQREKKKNLHEITQKTQTLRSVDVIKGIFVSGFVALYVICLFASSCRCGQARFMPHLFTFICRLISVKLPKMETRFQFKYGFIVYTANMLLVNIQHDVPVRVFVCVWRSTNKKMKVKKNAIIITESHTLSLRKPKYGKRYTSLCVVDSSFLFFHSVVISIVE